MNKLFTLFVTISLLLVSDLSYAGWPPVEEPPGAKLESMGGDLNYNGYEMRSWVFHTPLSVDRVLDYYRNRWYDDHPDETNFGPWQQISRKKGHFFITVQIQNGPLKGSIGRINMMDLKTLKESHSKSGKGIPMLSNTGVMNDIRSNDNNKNARTVAMVNKHSLSSNIQFYLNHYRNNNWSISKNIPVEDNGQLLIFKKSSQEITITIKATGTETAILINQTESRRWYQ